MIYVDLQLGTGTVQRNRFVAREDARIPEGRRQGLEQPKGGALASIFYI